MLSKDEIIRMALEAGLGEYLYLDGWRFTPDGDDMKSLERFAALVSANERNRHAWTQEHWTQYEHAIAAAEREACAKVCEEADLDWRGLESRIDCAAAIRSRCSPPSEKN